MSEPTYRDVFEKIAEISRGVEAARRTIRRQAFVIGVLLALLSIAVWRL